jgi:hypothetical protein
MEFMKLEGFLGRTIGKLVNKGIAAKFGYNPNIELKNLNLVTDNDEVILTTTMTMSQKDFERFFEEVTK